MDDVDKWPGRRSVGCDVYLKKGLDQPRDALRWRGLRALALATVALFVLIIASRLVFSDDKLVRQVISEGLSIVAWVTFWVPLEMLIFQVREHRLERKVYRLLSEMEITIAPTA